MKKVLFPVASAQSGVDTRCDCDRFYAKTPSRWVALSRRNARRDASFTSYFADRLSSPVTKRIAVVSVVCGRREFVRTRWIASVRPSLNGKPARSGLFAPESSPGDWLGAKPLAAATSCLQNTRQQQCTPVQAYTCEGTCRNVTFCVTWRHVTCR